jgi:hypothetical protein
MVICFCPINTKNNKIFVDAFEVPDERLVEYYLGWTLKDLNKNLDYAEEIIINIFTKELYLYFMKNYLHFPPNAKIYLKKKF